MSVRTRYTVEANVSSTSNEEHDLGDLSSKVMVDTQDEGGAWKTVVPAGAVNLPLTTVNVANLRYILIRTSAHDPTQTLPTITIKKNSILGEAYSIAPLDGARQGVFSLTSDDIGSLYVTNPSGTVAVDLVLVVSGGETSPTIPAHEVTQLTSISTGVTVNSSRGIVTTVALTAAARTVAGTFTVTNNYAVATSVVIPKVASYTGTYFTNGVPDVRVGTVADGSFTLLVLNTDDTNALAGTVDIHFIVI